MLRNNVGKFEGFQGKKTRKNCTNTWSKGSRMNLSERTKTFWAEKEGLLTIDSKPTTETILLYKIILTSRVANYITYITLFRSIKLNSILHVLHTFFTSK